MIALCDVILQQTMSLHSILVTLQGRTGYVKSSMPFIVNHKDTLYVEDGHQHVAIALLQGRSHLMMRVFDHVGE